MVLLFELSDVIEHFIQHKSAQSKVLGHTLQIAIDRSDNQHNSAGILLPWSTTKGATYMLSVSVELLEGDRAFIFGETADYQMRLIPRNYWVYPNQPLNQDILFQAQSETTVLGVLFNQKGLNYKALLTKFTLNQTRTHPETPIPEKIALPSLKNPDKKRLKSIRTQVTPSPYQIPIVNFGKPTVKRDEVPSSVAQKTSLDFFNPNYQPKSSAPTGQILIKRYPPWFNQSQSLLSGLVDQIYLIKWDHEEDWMDLQFKRLNLEYFLVYSVEKDDTTYQKLAQTKPPSFSLNHPDAQSYAQTQTYYQLLKHISRKRLKKVLIMDTNLLFKADFETQLKKLYNNVP